MPQIDFTLEDFRAVVKQEVQTEVRVQIQPVTKRLDKFEARFDVLEDRFDGLEGRFDTLETRFDTLETRFDTLETRFDTFERRFDDFAAAVADDYNRIEQRLIRIEADGKGIKRVVRKHAADIEELQTATGLR